mgnify:CR=1 FL=1
MIKIAVLSSTKATDAQALIDSIKSKKLNAEISVFISNKKDSYALERARKHNIKAVFLDPSGRDRQAYDKGIADELDKSKVDLVLLIGYLRILSPWFVKKYKNRIMNVHPSILPAFAGRMDEDVHKEVLDYGCRITGCTLHFVDQNVDAGPIIMQKAVEVSEKDNVYSLKEKVQKAEQEILVKAVDLFSKGKIKVNGRKVSMA